MRAAVFAGLVLTACAIAPAETRDPYHLHIEIGRWNAMASQVADLHAIPQQPFVDDDNLLAPASLARRLREAVWLYNLERVQLCAAERLREASCGAPYLPRWLNESPQETPSLRTIAARSEDVGERVMPFWEAVCAEARAAEPDEEARREICPME